MLFGKKNVGHIRSEKTLSDHTASAAIWTVGGKILARFLDFITLVVLARLLTSSDFGLVALAMTFIMVAEAVLELPIVQVLVRIPNPSKHLLDTAFTLSLLRSILIAVLLGSLSWPISLFYGDPRLIGLLCVLSLAPILRGLVSPRMVIFIQAMDFRRDVAMELIGKFFAQMIAISLAYLTSSYWAIAAGTIAGPLLMNCVSYIFAPYRPQMRLSEWPRFSNMVGWNSASQLMMAINWQIDRLLLGRFVSQTEFGRFSLASDISTIPYQALVTPIARPLLAAFSPTKQAGSAGAAYCKASNAVFLVAAPPLLLMSLLAWPLVHLILGDAWIEAVPLMTWLPFTVLVSLPATPMGSLAVAMDQTRMITIRSGVELLAKLPITIFSVVTFGIFGAVAARGLIGGIMLIVSMIAVKQLTDISLYRQAEALWRTVAALVAMAVCLLLMRPQPAAASTYVELLLASTSAAAVSLMVYGAMIFGLWIVSKKPAGIEQVAAKMVRSFWSKRRKSL